MKVLRVLVGASLPAFLLLGQASALAQSYPSRNVTVVVALAAGTGMDAVARLYATKLSEKLGRQFIIENRIGAGQNVAVAHVASSQPDGHTLWSHRPLRSR